MLRVFYIIIIGIVFFSNNAFADIIRGKVTDAATKEVVLGATVAWIKDGKIKKATVADYSGNYILDGIEEGNQVFQVRHIGYKITSKNVFIDKDIVELDFEIEVNIHSISPFEIIGYSDKVSKDVPGAISKMDNKKLEILKPVGTQDALEQIPGINAFSDDGMGNSRTSIGIRGLDPRRSAKVLILEDGIPLQPALYLYPYMYYNPPVERIDEIEVIKGSGAIKYGPQTMGGVINYITTRPRTSFGSESQLTFGNNNYFSFFNETGGFGNAKFQPEIQLLCKSADGFRENNHFNQFNGTAKVKILTGEKSSLYIKANVNKEFSDATYTGLTEYSFRTNPAFNPKNNDQFSVFRTSLDLIYEKEINSKLFSTSRTYLNYFSREWWRENDVFVKASEYNPDSIVAVPWYTEGDLIRVGNGRDNFGNLRKFYVAGYQKDYKYNHELFGLIGLFEGGFRGHWEKFNDDKKIGFAPDSRNGFYYVTKGVDEEWKTWNGKDKTNNTDSIAVLGQSHHYETASLALFVSDKIYVTEKLAINPGLRFETFEQERIDRLKGNKYQDKVSYVLLPGFGANYELNQHVNLFGGIHRGFTPPVSGTLILTNFGQSVNTDQELKPEKSWNSEIGLRGNGKLVNFEASVFHLLVQDMIAAGKGTILNNLGKIRNWGIENQATIHLSQLSEKVKWMPSLYANYTFLQTEVLTGEIKSVISGTNISIAGRNLPNAPEHTLTAGLLKEFAFGLTVMADVKYVSDVYTDFENLVRPGNRGDMGIVPSYYIFNANLKYQHKNWTVFVTGKNLTDKIYIGSRLHSNPGQPEANLSSGILPGIRRQVNVGLKYTFGKNK